MFTVHRNFVTQRVHAFAVFGDGMVIIAQKAHGQVKKLEERLHLPFVLLDGVGAPVRDAVQERGAVANAFDLKDDC